MRRYCSASKKERKSKNLVFYVNYEARREKVERLTCGGEMKGLENLAITS